MKIEVLEGKTKILNTAFDVCYEIEKSSTLDDKGKTLYLLNNKGDCIFTGNYKQMNDLLYTMGIKRLGLLNTNGGE